MLVNICSLWPYGRQESEKRLCAVAVANIGKNFDGTYNYMYVAYEPAGQFSEGIQTAGLILEWNRKNPCLKLIAHALKMSTMDGVESVWNDQCMSQDGEYAEKVYRILKSAVINAIDGEKK